MTDSKVPGSLIMLDPEQTYTFTIGKPAPATGDDANRGVFRYVPHKIMLGVDHARDGAGGASGSAGSSAEKFPFRVMARGGGAGGASAGRFGSSRDEVPLASLTTTHSLTNGQFATMMRLRRLLAKQASNHEYAARVEMNVTCTSCGVRPTDVMPEARCDKFTTRIGDEHLCRCCSDRRTDDDACDI